jgi:hypothetical protein
VNPALTRNRVPVLPGWASRIFRAESFPPKRCRGLRRGNAPSPGMPASRSVMGEHVHTRRIGRAVALAAASTLAAGVVLLTTGTTAAAGATAKAALAAEVEGRNPATFGGIDLPAQLRALITPSGRFEDRSEFGEFSNGFSQALALMSLRRTPGGVPVAAVNYEVGTECADGGFPLTLDTTPCVSDTDTTGIVVQALLANGRIAAAERGAAWLISKQQANGGISVGTGDATTAPNTNSTGLAGEALRAAGRPPRRSSAVSRSAVRVRSTSGARSRSTPPVSTPTPHPAPPPRRSWDWPAPTWPT